MFDDIIYAVENYREDSDKYHYFGTIVLEEDGKVRQPGVEWDKYNVIDGQQRLITTTILARVLSPIINSKNGVCPICYRFQWGIDFLTHFSTAENSLLFFAQY